ncbi:roundabout homolog 2-like isoform X2 [Engraulis encrasicolus]
MGPQLKVVEPTRTATMLCTASGEPEPVITWFKDFLPVDPSASDGRITLLKSGALQIDKAEEMDQGKYECAASNSQGVRFSAPANLYVRDNPRFIQIPKDQIVVSGETVSFLCQATGEPRPQVEWRKNGKKINSPRIEVIEFDEGAGAVLRIEPVRATRDEANYECVARNTEGEASVTIKLTILTDNPRFIQIPKDQIVVSGETVSFLCQATGEPRPQVEWRKNGKKINSPRIEVIEFDEGAGAVLRIQPVRATRDEANYECVARNTEGEASVTIKLTILTDNPRFIQIPKDQIVVSGETVSFLCQATGEPRPQVEWRKNGKKINSPRIEVIEFDEGAGAVLRIQPVRATRDEANYECVARNTEGEASVTIKLTILTEDKLPQGFPTIDMGPQLKVVERSRTATMLCTASGEPEPVITWFKDFLPVDPSTSGGRITLLKSDALQIDKAEEMDQGKYECAASNSQGVRFSAPANLYVRENRRVPPRFSVPPTNHQVMPGGSVNLTCVAVGTPTPYVKWVLGSVERTPMFYLTPTYPTPTDSTPLGQSVLELENVQQSANYTCVAISPLGIISAEAKVIVKCVEETAAGPCTP